MERIETTIREIRNYEHQFYCDECNKYLGTTEEYDDGYYAKLGELCLKIFFLMDGIKLRNAFVKSVKRSIYQDYKLY